MMPEELDTLKARVAAAESAGRRLRFLEGLLSCLRSANEIFVECLPQPSASKISCATKESALKCQWLGDEEGIAEELRQAVIEVIERRLEEAEERLRDA